MVQVSDLAAVRAAPWTGGTRGGSITLVVPEQPQTLLPFLAVTVTETQITSQLFAPVIRYSATLGGYEGILAESWSVQTDGRVSRLLVRLRPGLRWSDGTVLTASQVAVSYRRFHAPRARHPVTVTAVDGTAVGYLGVGPPDIVLAAAELPPLPVHWMGETISAARWNPGPLSHAIPVSGPFAADPRSDGSILRLRRNPFYSLFDEAGQPLPYLESVNVVDAAADAVGDIWRVVPGTTPTEIGIVATIPAGRIALLFSFAGRGPFSDPAVRRVTARAIEPRRLADDSWPALLAADGKTAPVAAGLTPDVLEQVVTAVGLLQPAEKTVRLVWLRDDAVHARLVQLLTPTLEAVGFAVRSMPVSAFGMNRHLGDAASWDLVLANIPANGHDALQSVAAAAMATAQAPDGVSPKAWVTSLIRALNRARWSVNREARDAAISEAREIWAEQTPVGFVLTRMTGVSGPGPSGNLAHVADGSRLALERLFVMPGSATGATLTR